MLGFILFFKFSYSQSFVNEDLEGNELGGLPFVYLEGWEAIPYTNIYSLATSEIVASPDVTNENLSSNAGLASYPYSGNTFVSGLMLGSNNSQTFFHEGIMQSVTGFEIDSFYAISFYQAVVKQEYVLDSRGGWTIIVDNDLIANSITSYSDKVYNELILDWEYRVIVFKATDSTHTIKFLTYDDDENHSKYEVDGAIRMGIDSISLKKVSCNFNFNLGDTMFCANESVLLEAYHPNATYLWQDNSTNSNLSVNSEDSYWVEVTLQNGCKSKKEVEIVVKPVPIVDLGDDIAFCELDSLQLNASYPSASYRWNNNSTESVFNAQKEGKYWVDVTLNGCVSSDTINIEYCVKLELPNIFTPNNDNFNDVFTPIEIEGIESLNTMIVNRWGRVIYKSDDLLINWEAKDTPDGIYYWLVNYVDKNGDTDIKKGTVQISR